MLFDDKEQAAALGGVTVKEAWIGLQILDKASANGVIQSAEFKILAEWRETLTTAIERATGKNYDEELQKAQLAQLQAQQAAAQAAAEQEQSDKTDSAE